MSASGGPGHRTAGRFEVPGRVAPGRRLRVGVRSRGDPSAGERFRPSEPRPSLRARRIPRRELRDDREPEHGSCVHVECVHERHALRRRQGPRASPRAGPAPGQHFESARPGLSPDADLQPGSLGRPGRAGRALGRRPDRFRRLDVESRRAPGSAPPSLTPASSSLPKTSGIRPSRRGLERSCGGPLAKASGISLSRFSRNSSPPPPGSSRCRRRRPGGGSSSTRPCRS